MASQDDADALQVLLADSAERVAAATRENAALVEQHKQTAAAFSVNAEKEIQRLVAAKEEVVAERLKVEAAQQWLKYYWITPQQ